jgi:hypothetical protein
VNRPIAHRLAQPADRLIRFFCLFLILLADLIAAALDWSVLRRQALAQGSVVPGDLMAFRQNAALALHSAPKIASSAAANLPYPPPFLLLSVPMSRLPPMTGYIAWVLAATLLLILAGRTLRLSWTAIVLGIISAPGLYCIAMGQTGIFVSAWLILSLGLAGTQPILAGIAAGCLIIKPQFAILLPICFLASRNWRAMISATATVLLLCTLTALLFGPEVWRQFVFHHAAAAPALLNRDWPQPYQFTMVTVFMMLRSLKAGYAIAYTGQAFASAGAAAIAWWLWRDRNPIDKLARLAATLCLVAIATPYAYIYDLPGLGLVLMGYAEGRKWNALIPLIIFCVFTSLYAFLSAFWFFTGAIFLVAILVALWPAITEDRGNFPLASTI